MMLICKLDEVILCVGFVMMCFLFWNGFILFEENILKYINYKIVINDWRNDVNFDKSK